MIKINILSLDDDDVEYNDLGYKAYIDDLNLLAVSESEYDTYNSEKVYIAHMSDDINFHISKKEFDRIKECLFIE